MIKIVPVPGPATQEVGLARTPRPLPTPGQPLPPPTQGPSAPSNKNRPASGGPPARGQFPKVTLKDLKGANLKKETPACPRHGQLRPLSSPVLVSGSQRAS